MHTNQEAKLSGPPELVLLDSRRIAGPLDRHGTAYQGCPVIDVAAQKGMIGGTTRQTEETLV
jgi:hypothetical protein